jgi:hypothetical protein
MPPNLRASFLRLRAALSRDNRAVWDAAARTPYERAYLVSMLHRASETGKVDALAALLERFSRRRPRAAMHELMDAIFFRGGDSLDTPGWDARYHPTLLERAAALEGSDSELLMDAHRATGALWTGWEGYGAVPSVRVALETGRMDCCMASTLIGNLYRNAGGTGSRLIRCSAGTSAHTVAAAEVGEGAGRRVLVVDGLDRAQQAPLLWPEDFVRGRPWPDGYPDATPPFFAFELYGRGLDNFIWLEGLIVAGRNAGLTIRADVPYLPGRDRRGRPDPDTATAGRGWGRTVANPASGSPTVR